MAKIGKNERLDREVRQQSQRATTTSTKGSRVSSPVMLRSTLTGAAYANLRMLQHLDRVPSLRAVGPLYPPRVKGRSKRGWTEQVKA